MTALPERDCVFASIIVSGKPDQMQRLALESGSRSILASSALPSLAANPQSWSSGLRKDDTQPDRPEQREQLNLDGRLSGISEQLNWEPELMQSLTLGYRAAVIGSTGAIGSAIAAAWRTTRAARACSSSGADRQAERRSSTCRTRAPSRAPLPRLKISIS